ncbi:hypothetical protein N7G274_001351 [Stereocaulon virgatum]|uniref:Uncharacterized protein n=1 Tax=Stereocaulon virgatum TaxID=373712 RepID=A0ABR4ANM4_9LECA
MTELCRSNCSKAEEASQSKPPRETPKGGFGYLSQILISIPIATNVLALAYTFYLLTYILTDFPARVNYIESGDPFYSSYISVSPLSSSHFFTLPRTLLQLSQSSSDRKVPTAMTF